MLENSGKTIKKIAKYFTSGCITTAVILVIVELVDSHKYLLGGVSELIYTCLGLIGTGIIGGLLLYGFGEIVDGSKK